MLFRSLCSERTNSKPENCPQPPRRHPPKKRTDLKNCDPRMRMRFKSRGKTGGEDRKKKRNTSPRRGALSTHSPSFWGGGDRIFPLHQGSTKVNDGRRLNCRNPLLLHCSSGGSYARQPRHKAPNRIVHTSRVQKLHWASHGRPRDI